MPQHDMWDYKPDAPAEIRGDFKPIRTNVPGIRLTDLLPHTREGDRQAGHPPQPDARRLGPRPRLPHHDDRHHPRSRRLQLAPRTTTSTRASGRWSPAWPSQGSPLPPYISVPCFLRSGGPAFLGPSYAPFVIEADPALAGVRRARRRFARGRDERPRPCGRQDALRKDQPLRARGRGRRARTSARSTRSTRRRTA